MLFGTGNSAKRLLLPHPVALATVGERGVSLRDRFGPYASGALAEFLSTSTLRPPKALRLFVAVSI